MSGSLVTLNVPAGATVNVSNNNDYVYLDSYDCFLVKPTNKLKLFLIGDNIWVIGNSTSTDLEAKIYIVPRSSNYRYVSIPVLNPSEQIDVSDRITGQFAVSTWTCFMLDPVSAYLVKNNDVWQIKSCSDKPIYNNKVLALLQ
jgi:hypothetical protein